MLFLKKTLYYIIINQFFINVLSHSWISCTDYQIKNPYQISNSINYDIQNCYGFSRNYQLQYLSDVNRGFGYDTGYNYKSNECKYTFDNNIQIAKYKPGQQVCLTYPSKNHVASECTNIYIPDNGIKIYRSINKQLDEFNKEYDHLNGIHLSNTIDYKGFQNCPGFCNNMDKTVCYVCFNLETDIESGIYSFKWVWEFNKGEFYSTCWDAEIINNNININNNTIRNLSNLNYQYNKNNLCTIQQSNEPIIQSPKPSNELIIQQSNEPIIQSPNPSNENNIYVPKKSCIPKINTESDSDDDKSDSDDDKSDSKSDPKSDFENKLTANIWEQCGGKDIEEKKCINSKCIKYSPYYSQCLPSNLEKNALCGQDDKKEIKWKYDVCVDNYKCLQMPGSMDYRCI